MKKITIKQLFIILIVVLAISIPIITFSNQNYLSGQIFDYVGQKIGIVQNTNAEEEAVPAENTIKVPKVISIPVPASGDVPRSFFPPQTEISSDTTVWGEGTPVVTGESVKINGLQLNRAESQAKSG